MVIVLIFLLGFQFSLVYIPKIFDYGTMHELTNLLCMAMGAGSIVWFTLCKLFMFFVVGRDDAYLEQA